MKIVGLSTQEAATGLKEYGPNQLPEAAGEHLFVIFVKQFNSPFIYVLLVAALVSLGLNQQLNAFFIFFVLLINAAVGAIQEYSAQKAAVALKKMVPQYASVLRDRVTQKINAIQLVPGDIVFLISGDRVAADLNLIECHELLIDESLLTGESLAAEKNTEFRSTDDSPLAECNDRAFEGIIVTHGRAQGEVIASGGTSLSYELDQANIEQQVSHMASKGYRVLDDEQQIRKGQGQGALHQLVNSTKVFARIEPVSFQTWFTLLGVALILIVVDEAHKKLVGHTVFNNPVFNNNPKY